MKKKRKKLEFNSSIKAIDNINTKLSQNIKLDIELKDVLRKRSINNKVIPNGATLKTVIYHLRDNNWNVSRLKKYEKNCYNAYKLDNIIKLLKVYDEKYWPEILRINILSMYGDDIGNNCADIYLVGFVAENLGCGEHLMGEYCKLAGITEKELYIKAIYNTGKSDGEYLEILNNDGTVADWDFFEKWVMG